MFITSPDWLITFINTAIALGATPNDASERRRIPMKGSTVRSLTIYSFFTPDFSRLEIMNIISTYFKFEIIGILDLHYESSSSPDLRSISEIRPAMD